MVSDKRRHLEEEFENTIRFINELAAGVRVVIPHLGLLNGGYGAFSRHKVWDNSNIYADTALASSHDIKDYIDNFGPDRILFGEVVHPFAGKETYSAHRVGCHNPPPFAIPTRKAILSRRHPLSDFLSCPVSLAYKRGYGFSYCHTLSFA